mmetsp:Transcript_9150/g.25750  ORF Transcript_9150/g.25750 Transcript_9150/m.25750 type:complete len:118 (+) Transcript_9150:2166-2519(+)
MYVDVVVGTCVKSKHYILQAKRNTSQKERLWSKICEVLRLQDLDERIPLSECKQRDLLGVHNNVSTAVPEFQSHHQSHRVEFVLYLVFQMTLLLIVQVLYDMVVNHLIALEQFASPC